MRHMATREQLHQDIDAVSDGQLPDVRVVVGNTGNGTLTKGRLSKAARDRQRARLRKLQEELRAEGADGSKYLPELERRAATWPE
jgi:hypothetical protein